MSAATAYYWFFISISFGKTQAQIMYKINPLPHNSISAAATILTIEESMLKYSAIPPQTPAIILSFVDLYNFFDIYITPKIVYENIN